jgi:hypothetical protein
MSRRKANPAGTATAPPPTAADDPSSPDPQASLSQKVQRASAPEDNTGQRSSRIAAFADEMLALAPTMAVSMVMCVLVTALALWVYDKRRAQVFAVVDLPGIVELEQLRLTVTAVAPGLSDAARQGLLADAQAFGDRLAKEIETLRSQCSCVLLTTSAFVGEPPADYTATLKARLGLEKLNAETLRKQAQSRLEASIPALAQPQSPQVTFPLDRSAPSPGVGGPAALPLTRP